MKISFLLFSVFLFSETTLALDVPPESVESPVKILNGSTPAPTIICEDPPARDVLCTDLATFTCAPGDYDDGTGVSRNGDARQEIFDRVKQSARGRLLTSYQTALSLPANSYFRETAKSAMGLAGAPDCTRQTPRCDQLIAEGLSQMSVKRLFPPAPTGGYGMSGNYGGPAPALKDLDYLVSSPAFLEIEQNEGARIRSELVDQQTSDRIRTDIFPEVQNQIKKLITERVTDPELRKNLTMKISSIRYEGTDCSNLNGVSSPQEVSLNSLIIPNAFYNAQNNTFKYCNGFLLTDKSEFKLVSVIAHELGHAIDPCNIARGPSSVAFRYQGADVQARENEFPFQGVISCLRSPQSVEARRAQTMGMGGFPPSPYPAPSPYPMPGGAYPGGGMSTPPEAGRQDLTDVFCNGDQIGESYSDWLASEVLPRYMNSVHSDLSQEQFRYGYSNVFRGMCSNLEPVGFINTADPHPTTPDRINRIILAHPEIRRHMGCQSSATGPRYCGVRP